jgi:hypothetical protein
LTTTTSVGIRNFNTLLKKLVAVETKHNSTVARVSPEMDTRANAKRKKGNGTEDNDAA